MSHELFLTVMLCYDSPSMVQHHRIWQDVLKLQNYYLIPWDKSPGSASVIEAPAIDITGRTHSDSIDERLMGYCTTLVHKS